MAQDMVDTSTLGVSIDLAHYLVDAAIIEGRILLAVIRAHGVSKSWVITFDGELLRHLTIDPTERYQGLNRENKHTPEDSPRPR